MRALFTILVLFLSYMALAPVVVAQTNLAEAVKKLETSYSDFEDHIRVRLPSYTLERKVREFDNRLNANDEVTIATNPKGAVATLHDFNTGEPLENCLTPCVLHLDGNREYLLTLFKNQHFPTLRPYRLDDYVETGTPYELGFDAILAGVQGRLCLRNFARSKKVDGDAKPCMRIGAIMPMDAKKSGHCYVSYDITARGLVTNASIKSCTEKLFEHSSLLILKWWVFTPKVERGEAVPSYGHKTKLTYILSDKYGNVIPE